MASGKKILYFINGGTPSEEDRQAALRVGTLMFRNALSTGSFDFVEECDGVAGAVPPGYEKFPRVDVIPAPPPPPAPPITAPEPPPPPPTPGTVTPPWKLT